MSAKQQDEVPVNVPQKLGSVRIAPAVLATIVRLTALNVPGVVRMYRDISSDMNRFFRGQVAGEGVIVEVVDDAVAVDLAVVIRSGYNLYTVGIQLQTAVARAITEMVGMPVIGVDVHIEEIEAGDPSD
ncbi:MAG: Asp23/Gls24 family envelope stress response protein [Chloroflexi bacterium]|nr:Asp23/Gls24 family envelope stress response protein [Chloroflexota bacterium]